MRWPWLWVFIALTVTIYWWITPTVTTPADSCEVDGVCIPPDDVALSIVVTEAERPEPWMRIEYPGAGWTEGQPATLTTHGWVPRIDCEDPEGERVECRLTFEAVPPIARTPAPAD